MLQSIYEYFRPEAPKPMQDFEDDEDDYVEPTEEESIKIVTFVWSELMKNKTEVGNKIYHEVLTKEISLSRLFLKTNLNQQSTIFMDMMNVVIGYLDDPSTMDQKLKRLGMEHVQKYSIRVRHLKHFKQAFLKAVKLYIPWNDRRDDAWIWFWRKIIQCMDIANYSSPLDPKLTKDDMLKRAKLIHETFNTALNTEPADFANNFYSNLLKKEPNIAKLFKEQTMQMQAAKFISMLRHAIQQMDDPKTFYDKIEKIAKDHIVFKLKMNHLRAFSEALIDECKAINIKYYKLALQQNNQNKDENKNESKDGNDGKDKDDKDNNNVDEIKENESKSLVFITENNTRLLIPQWNANHDDSWNWFWSFVTKSFRNALGEKDLLALKEADFGSMDLSGMELNLDK